MTSKQRFKKGEITFNEMLREGIARKFSGYNPPKVWEWLRARKEGYDFDYPAYLDGSENAGKEYYDKSAQYREDLRDVEKSLKTQ